MRRERQVWILVALFVGWVCAADGAPVDYDREIRPLLADACFSCHGVDASARKSGLRLDVRDEALKPAKSGRLPLVPGDPEGSEVYRRLVASDPT